MLAKRVIPCLDVERGRVVKGTNFLNLRDAGDPVQVAARYEQEGADERVFLDITASPAGRELMRGGAGRKGEMNSIQRTWRRFSLAAMDRSHRARCSGAWRNCPGDKAPSRACIRIC